MTVLSWPTKTTSYSIASSPWKGGKGDMVKDFMQASKNAHLKFGVYLSHGTEMM